MENPKDFTLQHHLKQPYIQKIIKYWDFVYVKAIGTSLHLKIFSNTGLNAYGIKQQDVFKTFNL